MTEGEQLLRAVLEEPGDDTVRLVYADWLEENGKESQSQLIRLMITQCSSLELSKLPASRWLEAYAFLPWGCWAAVDDIRQEVNQPLVIRRGFVSEIRLPAASFTEDFARELFSKHPIERVVLADAVQYREYGGGDDRPTLYRSYFDPRVWRLLTGPRGDQFPFYEFPTREDALAALSDACCLWGRSLVTPPLMPALVSATGPRRPTLNHRSPPTQATGKSETPTNPCGT